MSGASSRSELRRRLLELTQVFLKLGAAFVDVPTVLLAAAAIVVLPVWRVNPIWLILAAGLIGFIARLVAA